jgi:4a-hydroxytetrahydrobiopterin dehydratase
MSSLASRNCEERGPDTKPLDETAVESLMAELGGTWSFEGTRLTREFEFRNFRDAFGMATKVALLAEEQGHHPDFEVGWGRLALVLTTHSVKGLSENDFIMAAKIDQIGGSSAGQPAQTTTAVPDPAARAVARRRPQEP